MRGVTGPVRQVPAPSPPYHLINNAADDEAIAFACVRFQEPHLVTLHVSLWPTIKNIKMMLTENLQKLEAKSRLSTLFRQLYGLKKLLLSQIAHKRKIEVRNNNQRGSGAIIVDINCV